MAAKAKEVCDGKGKRDLSPSNPPQVDASEEITTHRQKQIPNYLKPTISSSNQVCNYGSRQVPKQTISKHSPRISSIVKLPSSASTRKRDPPGSPREKPLQPTSPSPKTRVSKRPISGSTPKSLKDGHTQPLEGTKNARKEAAAKERREAKATRTATIISRIIEKLERTPHQPQKEKQEDESLKQRVEKEIAEHRPLVMPPTDDESLCRTLDSDQKKCGNKIIEACDSTVVPERLEEAPGAIQISGSEGKTHHSEEQQEPHVADDKEKDSLVKSTANSKREEEDPDEKLRSNGKKWASVDPGSMKKPQKMQFWRGKVMNENERGGAESARLKLGSRGHVERVIEDLKPRSINVVLNHKGIQEKKEAAAFNDVIMETASKLLGKQRSRVKALVGAFETVISLQ